MAYEFALPDIGEGLTEAEILSWMVEVGEHVELDQPLVEVETAKAVVEIPAPRAGTVLYHGGAPGDVVAVGSILAVIGEPDEVWTPGGGDLPLVGTLSEEAEELPSRVETAAAVPQGPIKALPVVRKLAREHGIDLSQIVGTGPGGRIRRADVDAVIATGVTQPAEEPAIPPPAATPSPPVEAAPPATAAPAVTAGEDTRVRMSMLRRTIAEHMSRSWAEIPHVTTFDEVDAGRLLEVRGALGKRHDRSIPIEALVAKAIIPAIKRFPEFNATLDGEELVLHGDIHLAVAVDTDDGLLVPVIRSAQTLGVLELADRVVDLGERGRKRTLSPDELTGGTFTLSNIGAVGGGFGTPIVPHGTTAILSVGRAVDQPVARSGAVEIAPMMPLSLSYDHRVIDGGLGRRFMAMVLENLAEPALFLA